MTLFEVVESIMKGGFPIGHISHRKDGDYKKVSDTGDSSKDWKKIKGSKSLKNKKKATNKKLDKQKKTSDIKSTKKTGKKGKQNAVHGHDRSNGRVSGRERDDSSGTRRSRGSGRSGSSRGFRNGRTFKTAREQYTQKAKQNYLSNLFPKALGVLYPHQVEGVNLALEKFSEGHKAFFNADGTGAGKTFQQLAIAGAKANEGHSVLIVTANWQIANDSFAKDSKILGVNINPIKHSPKGTIKGKVYITTYTGIKNLQDCSFDTVIFDEAHKLKNLQTVNKEPSATAVYGVNLAQKAKNVVYASATPLDKGIQAAYISEVFKDDLDGDILERLGYSDVPIPKIGKQKENKDGSKYYPVIKDSMGKVVTEDKILSSLTAEEQADILDDIFDELTKKGLCIKREVSLDNLDVSVEDVKMSNDHERIWQQMVSSFKRDLSKNEKSAYGRVKQIHYGKMCRFNEEMKVSTVLKNVQKDLKAGKQAVIFCSRVNDSKVTSSHISPGTLHEIESRLKRMNIPVSVLCADTRLEDREKALKDFQSGKVKVFLSTDKSGGTGINLDDDKGNAQRSLHLMTLPYQANEVIQILGRINRANTKSRAEAHIYHVNNFIDEWNKKIALDKFSILGAVVGGDYANFSLGEDSSKYEFMSESAILNLVSKDSGIELPLPSKETPSKREERRSKSVTSSGKAKSLQNKIENLVGSTYKHFEVIRGKGESIGFKFSKTNRLPYDQFMEIHSQLKQLGKMYGSRRTGFTYYLNGEGKVDKLISLLDKNELMKSLPIRVINLLKSGFPIGHISHRKDGDYEKVANTGNAEKDWKKRNNKKKNESSGKKAGKSSKNKIKEYLNTPENQVVLIPMSLIVRNPEQPRKFFDPQKISELAESIKTSGLLQPITVRPKGNHFEIVAGERRWRAHKEIGFEKIKCMIKHLSDEKAAEYAMLENVTREDMTALEEAEGFNKMYISGWSIEKMAKTTGKSTSYVKNAIQMVDLIPEIKRMLEKDIITKTQAKIIASRELPENLQENVYKKISREKLTDTQLRNYCDLLKYNRDSAEGPSLFGGSTKESSQKIEEAIDKHIGRRDKKKIRKRMDELINATSKKLAGVLDPETYELVGAMYYAKPDETLKKLGEIKAVVEFIEKKLEFAKQAKSEGAGIEDFLKMIKVIDKSLNTLEKLVPYSINKSMLFDEFDSLHSLVKAIDRETSELTGINKKGILKRLLSSTVELFKSFITAKSLEENTKMSFDKVSKGRWFLHKGEFGVFVNESEGPSEKVQKSWSGDMASRYPGGRWVTITDNSSPLHGRHLFILPHKDGTATILHAPKNSGLTHKRLQPKKGDGSSTAKPKKEKKPMTPEEEQEREKAQLEAERKKAEINEDKKKKQDEMKDFIKQKIEEAHLKPNEKTDDNTEIEVPKVEVTDEDIKQIEKQVEELAQKEQMDELDKEKVRKERIKAEQRAREKTLNQFVEQAKNILADSADVDSVDDETAKNIKNIIKDCAEDVLKFHYEIQQHKKAIREINALIRKGTTGVKTELQDIEVVEINSGDIDRILSDELALKAEIDAHYKLTIATHGGIDREGNEIAKEGNKSINRNLEKGAYATFAQLSTSFTGENVLSFEQYKALGSQNAAVLLSYYMHEKSENSEAVAGKIREYSSEHAKDVAENAIKLADRYAKQAQKVREFGKGEDALFSSRVQATGMSLSYINKAYEKYGQAEGALNQMAEMNYVAMSEGKLPNLKFQAQSRQTLYNRLSRLGLNKSDGRIEKTDSGYTLDILPSKFDKILKAKKPTEDEKDLFEGEVSGLSIMRGDHNDSSWLPTAIKSYIPGKEPGSMVKLVPSSHQQSAARLVANKKKVFLNHEAGTGKSLTYLLSKAQIEDETGQPCKTIIAMPDKLMDNFAEEVRKFSGYNVVIAKGSPEKRAKIFNESGPDTIVLCNHGAFERDKDLIKQGKFDMVINDEAHKLTQREGQESSQMSRGLKEVVDSSQYYIAGTGTPTPNDLSELYFHLSLMNPDKYYNKKDFMARYGELHKGSGFKEMATSVLNNELSDRVHTVKKVLPVKMQVNEHNVELIKAQKQCTRRSCRTSGTRKSMDFRDMPILTDYLTQTTRQLIQNLTR